MSDKRTQPGCRLNPTALARPARHRPAKTLWPGRDEELLLEYARSGKQQAFEEIVRRYQWKIYSYLYRYLGDCATGGRRPASHVPASPPEVPPVRSGPPAQSVAVPDRHQSGQRPAAAQPAAQGSQSGPCVGRRRGQSGSVAVARLRGPGGSARQLLGGERGSATGLVGPGPPAASDEAIIGAGEVPRTRVPGGRRIAGHSAGHGEEPDERGPAETPPGADRRQQIRDLGRTEVKRSRKREAPPQLEWVGSEVNADGHAFGAGDKPPHGDRIQGFVEEPDAAVEQDDIAASGMEREGLVVGPAVLRGPRASHLTLGDTAPWCFRRRLASWQRGCRPAETGSG